MAALIPPGGTLIETPEDVFISETILADGFIQITSWDWEFIPVDNANPDVVPDNFTFDETDLSLTVNYHDNIGLFPVQYIEYVTPGVQVVRIFDQDELPDPKDSPELCTVRSDGRNFQTWNLIVSVTGLSDEGETTVTETYIVIVDANYNGIRDWIIDKVQEREGY